MFIIIEYSTSYRDGCADKVKITKDINGEPILFGSGHSAGKYAMENCKLNYKIVGLGNDR